MNKLITPSILMRHVIQSPDQKRPVFEEIKARRSSYKSTVLVFSLAFGCAIESAPKFGEYYGFYVAPAVPDVFTWLLADPVYFEHVLQRNRIRDFPNYDDFLSKKQSIFLNTKDKAFLLQRSNTVHYDPLRACMISPSLRAFFSLINILNKEHKPEFHFDLNKALLSNLVMEFYPANTEIYRSLDGRRLTGEQMVREIQLGSEGGRKYTSDLLRVSRDLLARQAAKG